MRFEIKRPAKIETVYFDVGCLGSKLLTIEVDEDPADSPYVDRSSKPGRHVYRFLGDFERPVDAADRTQADQPLPSPRVSDGDTLWQLLQADLEAVWGLSLTEAKSWWRSPSAAFFGDTPEEHVAQVAGFWRVVAYLRRRTIDQLRAQIDRTWAIWPDIAGEPGMVLVETSEEYFRSRVIGPLVIPMEIYHPGIRVFGDQANLVQWLQAPDVELDYERPTDWIFDPDRQDLVVLRLQGRLNDRIEETEEQDRQTESS